MINFRFHLVSLVAVFLALAVGVVMGYGVLGQPTVDTLQNRIDTVEANAEARRVENQELRSELDQREAAIDESTAFAVTDRLVGSSAVVLGVRGIDEGAVDRVVDLARRAGAEVPGVVWLEPAWALESPEEVERLAGVLGVPVPNRRAPLRTEALDALVARLADGPPTSGTDILQAFADAGFVAFDGPDDEEADDEEPVDLRAIGGAGTSAVLITGPDASVPARLVVAPIARMAVDADLRLVVSETFPSNPGDGVSRGDSLSELRDDETLDASVSTVDDAERPEGAVATILALADLERGVVGHYGIGGSADRQLPEWWQP